MPSWMPDTCVFLLTHSAPLIHLCGLGNWSSVAIYLSKVTQLQSAVRNHNPILSDLKACVLYATESAPTAMSMLSTHGRQVVKFLLPLYRWGNFRDEMICSSSHRKQPAGARLQTLCLPTSLKKTRARLQDQLKGCTLRIITCFECSVWFK